MYKKRNTKIHMKSRCIKVKTLYKCLQNNFRKSFDPLSFTNKILDILPSFLEQLYPILI